MRSRFALYEATVQSPGADVAFIDGVYRRRNGRPPRSLREDFCGSAALSSAWVKSSPSRRAVGIDLDPRALAYAERVHRASLATPKDQARLVLRRRSVLDPIAERFDVVAAYNFSYFVFHERAELCAYFRSVVRSLRKDGLFFLDVFGGTTAEQPSLEVHERGGVSYLWEQASFDPLTSRLEAYIHFDLGGGRMMRRAFRYRWRIWRIVELCEALKETGFSRCDVYWEERDDEGRATGRFRRRTRVPAEPSFTAYVIAAR